MIDLLKEMLQLPIPPVEWKGNTAELDLGQYNLRLKRKEGSIRAILIDNQFPHLLPRIVIEIFETYVSRGYVKFADMRNAPVPFKPFLKYIYRKNKFRFLNIMEGLKGSSRIHFLHGLELEGESLKDFMEKGLFTHELFENKILIIELWRGLESREDLLQYTMERLMKFLRYEAIELYSSLEVIKRHAERILNIHLEQVMGMDRLEGRLPEGKLILSRETYSDRYLLHFSPRYEDRQRYYEREPLLWNIQAANAPYADGTISDIDNDPLLPSWSFKIARVDRENVEKIDRILSNALRPTSASILLQEEEDPLVRKILKYKQVILYGPIGTGKTYMAIEAARKIAGNNYTMLQIHPSYSYEEFIEGIRPDRKGTFTIRDGIFKKIALEAYENPGRNYVIILDEFNRGNIVQILGELLYALEYRGSPITLPYSGEKLVVPENLYIIATMNTTDRSISSIDMALKRRFVFHRVLPDEEKLLQYLKEKGIEKAQEIVHLFRSINEIIKGGPGEDLMLGHTLFMHPPEELREILQSRILPILQSILHPQDYEKAHRLIEEFLKKRL